MGSRGWQAGAKQCGLVLFPLSNVLVLLMMWWSVISARIGKAKLEEAQQAGKRKSRKSDNVVLTITEIRIEEEVIMFSNVGGKIKGLAQVITWIGIVASVIGGIVLMSNVGFITGLLTAVVGSLFSWIGSLALYGFGQLVENSDQCVYYLTSIDHKKQA